ncbi:hypothetical protein BSL78_08598 [Apostichopus japonicus]|uniref:Ig-like domain-containing protein n=1 Tax=Stichopus japonicus TaxID=307972 RepID=A0A2G8L2P1_STIJA|nr:hypothetical protein BSL78_08598 [Apostichopus japonicus]
MKLSHLCVILQILVAAQCVKSEVICQDTYKVVLRERAAVSCTYDISFHTVRWYRYGSDESFLRIDGQKKSGSGFTSGEFDIEANGTMIITEVDIKHEGNYTISVLGVDGRGTRQELQIYVIAHPKDIVIQHCDSSKSSKACDHVLKDELADIVLCIAKDARPAVDITWFRISPDGPHKVNTPDNYTRTLNKTTSLYTTQSVLSLDKNSFSLQYFICSVSGHALKDKTNVSILINGNVPYGNGKMEQKYVMEGDTVELFCPNMSYPLAYAKITMADRREEVWMRLNPSSQSDECFGQSICVFPTRGLISLTALNRYQDTSLECIYGNGKSAERHVTNVTVMVIPKASSTVINGCESFKNCSQSIPSRGRIKCSVFGVKPPVSLIMKANERSAGDIEFSEESNTIQKDYDSVTSSTHLSAAYEIQECVDLVKVTCLPSDNELQEYILASQVVLQIDKSTCSGGGHGALVAVLTVGFVLIVCAAVIFTYMYTKGHLSKVIARCSSQKQDSEEGTALNTDQTDGAQEKKVHQDSNEVTGDDPLSHQPLLQDDMNGKSKEDGKEFTHDHPHKDSKLSGNQPNEGEESTLADVPQISKAEEATQESAPQDQQTQINQPKEEDKSTQNGMPQESQTPKNESTEKETYLPGDSPEAPQVEVESNQSTQEEDSTPVEAPQTTNLDELVESFINEPSKKMYDLWRSILDSRNESLCIYLKRYIPDKMKMTEDTITAIMKFFATCKKNGWITSEESLDLVTITVEKQSIKLSLQGLGIAYALKQIDEKQYAKISKPLTPEFQISGRDLADSIIHYFITHEIPYPYFLQSMHDKFQGDRSKNKLSPLFKDIVQKATSKAKNMIFTDEVLNDLSNSQELSEIFLRALFFSVQEKTIDGSTCVDILKTSLRSNQITNADYHKSMNTCCKDGWLTGENVLSILHHSLDNRLDKETYFLLQMKSLLQDKKINLNQWVDELKLCRREGMVDRDSLHLQVKDFISNTTFGWTKEKWIKLVCELQDEKLLGSKKCSNLLQIIIDKHDMTEREMNSVLELPTFELTSVPKNILHKVKFKQQDEHPESSQLFGKQKHDGLADNVEMFSSDHYRTPSNPNPSLIPQGVLTVAIMRTYSQACCELG